MYSTPLKKRVDYNNETFTVASSLGRNRSQNQLRDGPDQRKLNLSCSSFQTEKSTNKGIINNYGEIGSTIESELHDVNTHVKVSGLASSEPLQLASEFVQDLNFRDKNTPVLDNADYNKNGVKYNFSDEVGGLGAFTPFQRRQVINIPDEVLLEVSSTEIKSDMGVFPELDFCWITSDNKLILWNINNSSEFHCIEEIEHTILKVKLVKPRQNTFVSSVENLLIVATLFDIYILTISFDDHTHELNISNTGLKVNATGLNVSNIISYEKTGQIFFTGSTDGVNVWELQYNCSENLFKSKCNKICLTKSSLANLLPTKLIPSVPRGKLMQRVLEEGDEIREETILQLDVDQSRGILHTLSTKSIIRSYLITNNGLENPALIDAPHIRRSIRAFDLKDSSLLTNRAFKIAKIVSISKWESNDLFLVVITTSGVRLYFKGISSKRSIGSLKLDFLKLPPASLFSSFVKNDFSNINHNLPYSRDKSLISAQKASSVYINTSYASTIISPGIYFTSVTKPSNFGELSNDTRRDGQEKREEHKLYVSAPDYGLLKNYGTYVENTVLLDTTDEIKEIVPLTKCFNYTSTPQGYTNVFASQYNVEPLKVAVLTSNALEIYCYRTPDEVFESLIENPLPFIHKYGLSEACSTALYLACKFNKSEYVKAGALAFFSAGIPGVVEIKPKNSRDGRSLLQISQKKLAKLSESDDIVLSPRFYGSALLIARLFNQIWEDKIFIFGKASKAKKSNIFGISITRSQVEYYLSSISVLADFFDVHHSSFVSFLDPKNSDATTASDAESIAMNSLILLINSIKDALSLLNVFYEDIDTFKSLLNTFTGEGGIYDSKTREYFLNLEFHDLFTPNTETKRMVKEILIEIVNANIASGAPADYIMNVLKERFGSFCHGADILCYRAGEHLEAAQKFEIIDPKISKNHLDSAIDLYERCADNIKLDELRKIVNMMVKLDYQPRTIEFLLKVADKIDKENQAQEYISGGCKIDDPRKVFYNKRVDVYKIIFEILKSVDNNTSIEQFVSKTNIAITSPALSLKESVYSVIINSNNRFFHYCFYDWLVANKRQDDLLKLDSNFVLPYLKERAEKSLEICNLLWLYLAKEERFFEAAAVLYALAGSDFDLKLSERIECLARANGFCDSSTSFDQRPALVQLSDNIHELFDIAAIQDDLLNLVRNETRINENYKKQLISKLNGEVLSLFYLFNDYADPLEYYEIKLKIFRVSHFKDKKVIQEEWDRLIDSIRKTALSDGKDEGQSLFFSSISSTLIRIGKTTHDTDVIFPVHFLINRLFSLFPAAPSAADGSISSVFLLAGISHLKLYYILKDIIKNSEENIELARKEMVWLIKEWYQNDPELHGSIVPEQIKRLEKYDLDTDPVQNYVNDSHNGTN